MTKHRSYLVCKCGSWVFQDRVASGQGDTLPAMLAKVEAPAWST